MKKKDFYGYTIYENGDIKGLYGKMLKQRVRKGGRKEIKLSIDEKKVNFIVSRLVYCVFNNIDIFELDKDQCVVSLDGDKSNVDISNLDLVYRGDLIQGSKHEAIAKLSDNDIEAIKTRYKATEGNRPVNQYDNDKPYNSYRSLAREYGVTHPMIKQIVEGKTRSEDNYILKEDK